MLVPMLGGPTGHSSAEGKSVELNLAEQIPTPEKRPSIVLSEKRTRASLLAAYTWKETSGNVVSSGVRPALQEQK